MDILDDIGVSKLSAKVFLKVNYSFNAYEILCSILDTAWYLYIKKKKKKYHV